MKVDKNYLRQLVREALEKQAPEKSPTIAPPKTKPDTTPRRRTLAPPKEAPNVRPKAMKEGEKELVGKIAQRFKKLTK